MLHILPPKIQKDKPYSQESSKLSDFYSEMIVSLNLECLFRPPNNVTVRFAIKVGAGAALWAMFAFIPETRPLYAHWRGEWGLLSFMLVCSMTIGASNTTGYSRFIGTLIGAILSVIVWFTCQGNPFALAFCGWTVSFVCFYFIVGTSKGPMGRFLLLTVRYHQTMLG